MTRGWQQRIHLHALLASLFFSFRDFVLIMIHEFLLNSFYRLNIFFRRYTLQCFSKPTTVFLDLVLTLEIFIFLETYFCITSERLWWSKFKSVQSWFLLKRFCRINMFSQLNSKGSDVAIFSNPTRSRVLPGGEGHLTDWGQGVDIFAQLVKLFSWEEHVCEYFSEFENCFLTNGCQLLGVCRKVISVTSPRLPAANKFVSTSNIWIFCIYLQNQHYCVPKIHIVFFSIFVMHTFCYSF